MMKKLLILIIGWGLGQTAYADEIYSDDLVLSGLSDGTSPAYDCTAGVLLPINMAPTPGNDGYFDTSGIATQAIGDEIIEVRAKGPVVNDPVTGRPSREYDCVSPIGQMCVGVDCSNNENFNEDTLKLKENNLRIRFVNTAFGNTFGQSWNIEANSSTNGGPSYFNVQTKSVEKNFARVVQDIDGAVPAYDCSIPGTINTPPDPVGTLTVGDAYITPVLVDGVNDCDLSTPYPYECIWTCQQETNYQVESAVAFGVSDNSAQLGGAVSLGSNSRVEAETVTIGRADLLRRVVHVADAINDSDLINLQHINDYSVVADQSATLADLRQQLADINNEIDSINVAIDLIIEVDDDGDGFTDVDENTCGSDPLDANSIPTDTDSDGLCDNGVDNDDDGDGLSDEDEADQGTDPTNSDTDGDGVNDAEDPAPLDPNENGDADGDGIADGADTDDDNDGIDDSEEGTYDADGDGLSNDLDSDSDNDGISDKDECPNGSPCPDSDGDGTPDFLDAVDNSGGGSWSLWGLMLLALFGLGRRYKY